MNGLTNFIDLSNFAENDRQLDAFETLFDPITKYLLYGGAAGGGKSYFLRWIAVALGFYYNTKYGISEVPIGLFSEDYPTLRDRQLVKIAREFPKELGDIKEHKIYGFAFIERDHKFVIMLRNLDDPSKYSSVEFASILVEELTKNKRSMFDDLRSRMRFPGIPDPKFVAATNPGEIGHGWVKSLWIKPLADAPDPESERFRFVPALYTDNKFVDPNYEKQLLAISDPQKRKALMEGDWEIFEGQVFSEWRYRLHVPTHFDYPPDACRKIICFDWGFNAPGCALWLAFTPENHLGVSRCYVYRELYQNQKTPEQWASDIKSMTGQEQIDWMVLPHDAFAKGHENARDSIAHIFNRMLGYSIIPGRTLEKDARQKRLAVTHNWLGVARDGRPYLQVHPNCLNLIRTLPELVYDKNHIEDVDTEGEDHAYDALSLGLMSWGHAPKEAGIVKPVTLEEIRQARKFWKQDDAGSIQSPDFWDSFKEAVQKGPSKSWEYR